MRKVRQGKILLGREGPTHSMTVYLPHYWTLIQEKISLIFKEGCILTFKKYKGNADCIQRERNQASDSMMMVLRMLASDYRVF
jgi:hypothetical protein